MSVSIAKNMDCLEFMAGLPDNFADLAICDPPYGLGFSMEKARKATTTRSAQFQWDCKEWDWIVPTAKYFTELFRVSKNQIIWGGNYFLEHLSNTNCVIVWNKQNPEGMRFADGEIAWASFKTALRIFSSDRTYKIEKQYHPTQKPVALYKWLLKNYAKPGDKILDTHLGSGSSRIAAYDLGFDFYSTELDKDYFEAQEKRFADHCLQPKLFEQPKEVTEQTKLF